MSKTQLSGFLVYYVDGDYVFQLLCWAIIRSQKVQVRRLYSVGTLAMERTSTNFQQDLIVTFCITMAVQSRAKFWLKMCKVHYQWAGVVGTSAVIGCGYACGDCTCAYSHHRHNHIRSRHRYPLHQPTRICNLHIFSLSLALEYRVIHKSLRDFRTRPHNNQDRHGGKEHINR